MTTFMLRESLTDKPTDNYHLTQLLSAHCVGFLFTLTTLIMSFQQKKKKKV